MLRNDKQEVAVNLFANLLVCLVLHVVWVFSGDTVNDDLLGKLDSKSVLVNSDLLDVVAAADLDTGLSHQMLDDHVGHQLAVRVTVLIEAMHCQEFDIVHRDVATVCSAEHVLCHWVHSSRPDPISLLSHCAKQHTVFVPKSELLVTATDSHVFASWEE